MPRPDLKRAADDARQRNFILNESDYAARSWAERTFGYSSQIIDPPNGRMPAKTANAKPRSTRGSYSGGPWDDFEDFTLYDRCITRGMKSINAGARGSTVTAWRSCRAPIRCPSRSR